MSVESPPRFIYKIVPSPPGDPFPKEHPLSELDQNDGFVHLSTSTQVSAFRRRCYCSLMQVTGTQDRRLVL
ncbi:hypothetical protein FOC1_g10012649 [Fusarium oxysporum f. sp. cubense race 1]|uniref:DUF952 domain-containing protein n=1 Tax=Fusarium oxysporum f. sp. cubense (strain race 1) TaxID=1229664 RepID=N4U0U1_FUSC1|nr:hypothetical protein FOC1_g10012649 [Fusarium oxysporum f. sp. cubense race 1]